ncbi:MAG: ATP synthase F1 subunit delta [Melioribacteraceae bacterium]|nr:ATP synthase F1 subunit delta [Melioribacteraceae bacterium]
MANLNVSNRYASALYEDVSEKGVIDRVSEDMRLIHSTLEASKELRNFLASPVIKDVKKIDILHELFSSKTEKETVAFLDFIVQKKRINILSDIVKRFNDIHDRKTGVANAEIITAHQLDEEEKKLLKDKLEKFANVELRVSYKVDDGIIGGFISKINDKVIDATLRNQLKKLKMKLLEETVSQN